MTDKAKIREGDNAVDKTTRNINWANIIDPRAIPVQDTGMATQAFGGEVIRAGVKYGVAAKKSALADAQATESASIIGNFSKILANADRAIAEGANPQAVQNAAYAQMSEVVSGSQHLKPSDQIDMMAAGRNMMKDAVGMKTKLEQGILTIADGYGHINVLLDKASENRKVMEDIVKGIGKEKPYYAIELQEIQVKMSQVTDPSEREKLSVQMQDVINRAKEEMIQDHTLATMKLQREIMKADVSVSASVKSKQYAEVQNLITNNFLNYSGETWKKFIDQNKGKNPSLIKAAFNNWIKQQVSTKAMQGTLADLGKSTDDIMSDLSTVITLGEDLIDAQSTKSLTDFEIKSMEAEARLKTLKLIGSDGMVKIGIGKALAPIMNINYVMARQASEAFQETQWASGIVGSVVGGEEAMQSLEQNGKIVKQHGDAIINSMKGYYNEGPSSVQGVDLFTTIAFATIMAPEIMNSDASPQQKQSFLTLQKKLKGWLPAGSEKQFNSYVEQLKGYFKTEE